jgi:hypothetical protein
MVSESSGISAQRSAASASSLVLYGAIRAAPSKWDRTAISVTTRAIG